MTANTASFSNWKKPGQAVQMLFAQSLATYQNRNDAGQFRHVPTHREIMLEALRDNYAPPQVEPNALGSAGCGEAGESAPQHSSETGARFVIGNARNNRWRSTPAVSAGIKPGPHPPYLIARAACLLVAAASIIASLSIDVTLLGLLASLPAPKLIAAALGRV